ncbi:unnamed protein product [Caretta caretta]
MGVGLCRDQREDPTLRFAYEQLARVDGEVVEAQHATQWPRFELNHERLYRLDQDPQTQEPYAFTIHHRAGRDNANADFLSRLGEGEALGKEESDREEGLWQPGLPAAEYPEDLEGPDCSLGQRESGTEGEREWPAAEYPAEMEGPERPA